jgi:hypothetical protein
MKRTVKAEILDELPPDDPSAIGSRRDLERINWWMGNAGKLANALSSAFEVQAPRTIVELGAGDGNLMLRVASRLSLKWRSVQVILVDRLKIVRPDTAQAFKDLGWEVENVQADALEWLQRKPDWRFDVIAANLFLHHFSEPRLRELLRDAANRTQVFLATEPPRGRWPLAFCGMLGLIGCNRVTRHDAALSVRAGFTGQELSGLWPGDGSWILKERMAGIFSHLFVARKREQPLPMDSMNASISSARGL